MQTFTQIEAQADANDMAEAEEWEERFYAEDDDGWDRDDEQEDEEA